jgi:2-polyprenyl-6-methoxyphenol hydroxylase-like FAD-dependent oxidoreductase
VTTPEKFETKVVETSVVETSAVKTSVAIVGGGPVGLMLALFLDRHGVPSVVFNVEDTTRWHPKGSTHNSRTMEHYRRLGISAAVRRLGLPHDHPTDVAYFTRFNAWELARIRMPSEAEKVAAVVSAPRTAQNFEPIHRANQMYVEEFLLRHARTRPNITLRFGWRVDSFAEDSDGVTVQAERVADGARETWQSAYLAGCDGGQSHVRRALGIRYQGFDKLDQAFLGGKMVSTYIRAPSLYHDLLRGRRAWQYWVVNPQARNAMVALNGQDEFMYWTKLADASQEPSDAVVTRSLHAAAGADVPVEILGHRTWSAGVALWAERFSSGNRVFLAGDAIHLFTPTGGFGMNTGIDGAANLAWKLAAMVQGWGGSNLPGSFETERMPIAKRNTVAARELAKNVGEVQVLPEMEEDSPRGEAARRVAGDYLATFGEEFASVGVQLGVRYDGSPLIVGDGAPPADDFVNYVASGVPGGRAPHLWLDDGAARTPLFDRFGTGFTLLRLAASPKDAGELVAAAARSRIPLAVLDLPDAGARALYGRDLVLIRPDQHICWRGDALPRNAEALLATVTGNC